MLKRLAVLLLCSCALSSAQEIHINDDGTLREITGVFINDDGTLREIESGWINDDGTLRQIYAAAAFNLNGESVNNLLSGVATVHINSDGTVDKTDNGGRAQIDSSTDWIIPNGSASSDYDVRYTNHTGTALSTAPAAEDSWSDLSTDRAFGLSGTGSATFDIEIRDGEGTTVATGSYSLTSGTP